MAQHDIGRRVRKSVDVLDGGGPDYSVTWVYSGWNKIQETKSVGSTATTKNFVWGLDLSQSMQGAGGIGGLLAVVDGGGNANLFAYDGNGNVSELVNASTGAVQAHYEYDAFGNTVLSTGSLASENCYRFSTKEIDDETGLHYYGYRYYDSVIGRWTQSDLIGERGGVNLYGFVGNRPTDRWDRLGLYKVTIHVDMPGQNPTKPSQHESEYTSVGGKWDQGHAWVVFDAECGPSDKPLAVGLYPAVSVNGAGEIIRGVRSELRDDSAHHFEYEYSFKVSKEKYEEALKYALAVRTPWAKNYACVDFTLDVARVAGKPLHVAQTTATHLVFGSITMRFPGKFAQELQRNGLGGYRSGGSPGHTGGSFGFWLDHDTHVSKPLRDLDPASYLPQPEQAQPEAVP